jgi:hypothetical protein
MHGINTSYLRDNNNNIQREINIQVEITMKERTYLYQNQSPTGCRPRTFHPTLDIVVPSLNNRSPPSQGYESTRTVSGYHSTSQPVNIQALIGFSHTTNPVYQLSLSP